MTDRVHSLTVVLKRDMRDDDVKSLVHAIYCLRNVLSVTEHVSDIASHMAECRAIEELGQRVLECIYPKSDKASR